jgi:hypothetical protein
MSKSKDRICAGPADIVQSDPALAGGVLEQSQDLPAFSRRQEENKGA